MRRRIATSSAAMLPPNVLEWIWHQLEFNYTELARAYREIVESLEQIPSLRPRTDVYTFESGNSDLLVVIYGPLPTNVNGQVYGIPIEMWIPKSYPIGAPIVWVRPTPEMRINSGTRVDKSGRVYFEWHSESTLLDTLNMISQIFSVECPVYSVPSTPRPDEGEMRPRSRIHEPTPPSASVPSHSGHIIANIMDLDISSPKPALPDRGSGEWDHFCAAVRDAADNIVKNEVEVDLEALKNTQSVLDWTENSLAAEKQALYNAIDTSQRAQRLLDQHIEAARKVIKQASAPELSLITADDLVVPESTHASHALQALANDAAIGEALITLAAGLAHEKFDLSTYLKNVRSLARRQFFERHQADVAARALV